MDKLAQTSIPFYPNPEDIGGKLEGKGILGLEGIPSIISPIIFARVISIAIGLMTVIAFIYFLFLLMIGALGVMTAGGDKAKVAEARSKITSGLIGLVIVISAIFIVQLITSFFGIDLGNLQETIFELRIFKAPTP